MQNEKKYFHQLKFFTEKKKKKKQASRSSTYLLLMALLVQLGSAASALRGLESWLTDLIQCLVSFYWLNTQWAALMCLFILPDWLLQEAALHCYEMFA